MERIKKERFKSTWIPRTRLFREQIEHIIETLRDANLTVVISDDNCTYRDLDDLKENRGSRITDLTITGRVTEDFKTKDVSFEFSQNSDINLWLSSGYDAELEAVWYRLGDIVAKNDSWHRKVFVPWLGWGVLTSVLGLGPFIAISRPAHFVLYIYFAILIATLLYFLCSIYWRRTFAVIMLDKQHEVLSFWGRNGDKIILLLIGTIFGTAATLITTWSAGLLGSGAD